MNESDLESISVESTNVSINEASSIESITNEALSSLDDLAEFSLSFPDANDENLAEGQLNSGMRSL